jgi:CTP:molybdopterin cytidylyltransferase MocA
VETTSPRAAAVILAAGGSTRFGGGAKQLARIGDRSMVRIAVEAARASGAFEEVAVVVGAVDLDGELPEGIEIVENPDWTTGQASSVQAGLRWAGAQGYSSVVVGLADQPGVTAEAWRLVATSADDHPILVATYAGRRGNPVRLDASIWSELPTEGDEGARALIGRRPGLVGAVPCPGTMVDIDTQEDLDRWN